MNDARKDEHLRIKTGSNRYLNKQSRSSKLSDYPKLSKSDIKSVVEEAKVVSIDSGEKCGGGIVGHLQSHHQQYK